MDSFELYRNIILYILFINKIDNIIPNAITYPKLKIIKWRK